MTLPRRDFLLLSALSAGGYMVSNFIKGAPAHASAPMAHDQVPGLYRTKIGAIEVTAVLDGRMALPQNVLMTAPPAMIEAARKAYAIPAGDTLPAFVNSFLVNTPQKTYLVDTGARGLAPTLGHSLEMLKMAGVQPDDIDEIVITHGHPDHVGGLLGEDGKIAFGKSTIRLCDEELDFWFNDTAMAAAGDKVGMFETARKCLSPYRERGQIQTFKRGADLGNGLSAYPLAGHTPGHHGVKIADGNDGFLIWADLIHFPAVQFDHPEQSVGFDVDPEAARKTRQRVFEEIAKDGLRVAGMHLFFPAIGRVVARPQGFAFIPQLWESDLS